MRSRHRLAVAAAVLLGLSVVSAQQASAPALTPEQMAAFLEHGRIIHRRDAGNGTTGSVRLTLTDGRLTHDAHLQTIDDSEAVYQTRTYTELDFKDTYRYNIAAYRLAQLIGVTTVPMSVRRRVEGRDASVTWWLDDIKMDERHRLKAKVRAPDPVRTARQLQVMRIFDELIQNRDRNQGNMLWTSDWTLWLIDHTRAFRLGKDLLKPQNLTHCERGLLDRLKAMTKESLAEAVGDSLMGYEQEMVLARRDRIVKLYEDRIARQGEAAILFTR